MSVILKSSFVLSESKEQPLTHARILYRSIWRRSGATISASSEQDDFPATAAKNELTYEFWRPSSLPATWEVDAGQPVKVDAVGIASHTLSGHQVEVQKYNAENEKIIDSFDTPVSNVQGVAFDGNDLISGDPSTETIYVHDGLTKNIKNSFQFGQVRGMTFDGENLITTNGQDTIYVHDGISDDVLFSFSSPDSAPRALAFDGKNLISADDLSNEIYIHDGVSDTIKSSFSMDSVVGLAFDGFNLISAHRIDEEIRVHEGITATIRNKFSYPSGETSIGGLTIANDNKLVAAGEDTDAYYVYDYEEWSHVDGVIPKDDTPLLFLFGETEAPRWRVRISGGSGTPSVGVIFIGKALAMERPIYGGHSPINLSRTTNREPNRSERGQWLGLSLVRRGVATDFNWQNLTASWYRANFDPFVEYATQSRGAFFIAWRPKDFPKEVGYCWVDEDDIQPSNSGTRDLMEVSMRVRGQLDFLTPDVEDFA